jgi:hypothetical protein
MLITNNPVNNGQAPVNGASLVLKAGSGITPNFVRVRYNNNAVELAIVTNAGIAVTQIGSVPGTFVTGDTLTAMVDSTGVASVWKTTAANVTTYLGFVQLPTTGTNAFTTGTGRIGIQVPTNSRVDNFSGGTVP